MASELRVSADLVRDKVGDPSRLAALRQTELLDTPPEEAFDRLTRLAARSLRVPVAMVTLVDADRDFVKSHVDLPAPLAATREITASPSFCQYSVATGESLVLDDARAHAEFSEYPAVRGMGVVACVNVPLVTAGGEAIGNFCIVDMVPRAWTDADRELLATLAACAVTEIELRAAARAATLRAADAERATRVKEAVLDGTPDAVFMVDAGWCLTLVNDKAASFTAHPARELLGRELWACCPELLGTPFETAYRQAMAERRAVELEAPASAGGRWYAVHAVPQHAESAAPGAHGGLAVYVRDVTERHERARALREREALLSAVMEGTTDALWVKNSDGRYRLVNGPGARMMGRTVDDVLGRTDRELFTPESADAIRARDLAVLTSGVPRTEEAVSTASDGGTSAYLTTRAPLTDGAGVVVGVIGVSRDITERARGEAAVRASEERLRLAIDAARLSVWERELDVPAVRFWANGNDASSSGEAATVPPTARPSGPDEGAYRGFLDAVHPDDQERVQTVSRRARAEFGAFNVEYRVLAAEGTFTWRHTFGRVYPPAGDRPARMVGVDMDVTERKVLEEQLAYQAFHDPLTGLANRVLFRDRVEHALSRAGRSGAVREHVAVLFLDLDDFKSVNDTLGHAEGDRLLEAVAARLLRATRGCDTVARLGGDEFAVLLEDMAGPDDALTVAERIVAALRAPVGVTGKDVLVSASIGIAHARPDDSTGELLRNADVAMYQAKEGGKGCARVFEPAMHAAIVERLTLAADLRHAVDRGELRLLYQPIVELESGRLTGVEALVRWQHPDRGLVAPAVFIPLAEEVGMIVPVGRWVLVEACRQLRSFDGLVSPGAGPDRGGLTMSINLSGLQLQDPELVAHVAGALAEAGVAPARVVLEITESVLMRHAEETIATLHALKALGVRLAIDDFGTGYSSLSYLQRFPVDVLKIDKAFVDGVARGGSDAALARAIIALGDSLGLRTVAEGIEHPEQWAQLAALGCGHGQGYLFARPLTAAALASWRAPVLDAWRAAPR
jgi:diguanylate cyclase (GGDEF)-like protein/PAS domain S-box-containing protein